MVVNSAGVEKQRVAAVSSCFHFLDSSLYSRATPALTYLTVISPSSWPSSLPPARTSTSSHPFCGVRFDWPVVLSLWQFSVEMILVLVAAKYFMTRFLAPTFSASLFSLAFRFSGPRKLLDSPLSRLSVRVKDRVFFPFPCPFFSFSLCFSPRESVEPL